MKLGMSAKHHALIWTAGFALVIGLAILLIVRGKAKSAGSASNPNNSSTAGDAGATPLYSPSETVLNYTDQSGQQIYNYPPGTGPGNGQPQSGPPSIGLPSNPATRGGANHGPGTVGGGRGPLLYGSTHGRPGRF